MEILQDYSKNREKLKISSFFRSKKADICNYNSKLDLETLTPKELESHWRDIIKTFIKDHKGIKVIYLQIIKTT